MVQGHGVPDTLDGTGVASRTSLTACLRFMATFTVIVMAVFVVLLAHAEEPNPEERFNKILRAEEPTKQEGFEEILDEYQERRTADLESIKAVGELVDECHRQQLDAQVAAFYTEKTRGEPESFLAWYGLGRALAMHGRYAEAKNILTRARPLVQDLPPAAVRLLVWCHANLKEHEESLRICKKYLKDNPDDAYCLRGACSALWALDRYDEAVEYGKKQASTPEEQLQKTMDKVFVKFGLEILKLNRLDHRFILHLAAYQTPRRKSRPVIPASPAGRGETGGRG